MSGYLQRLVDAASGRSGSVYPRTGSIFSPRLDDIRAPLQGWEETEHVTAAPSPPHARPASRAVKPPEPPRRARPRSGHVPLLPQPLALDSDANVSASPSAPAALTPRPVDDLDASPEEPPAERVGRPPAADTEFHITVAAPARSASDAFRPVMKSARVSEPAASAVQPTRPLPGNRHAAPAAQPPDDIQIHIGRIEVTAVPPPVPRAPSAHDPKLSLDAYLNRRNGRGR